MKTYITNIESGYDYQYSATAHSPFYIKINLEGPQPGNNALSDLLNRQTSEVELLFGDELKEYKKINENKEKIKNILGEDFNMEINFKEIVEKVLDERAAKNLHETNYEIECLKQKVRELEADNAKLTADNTELATSFKRLLEDQEEALDYIDELEASLDEVDELPPCGDALYCCEENAGCCCCDGCGETMPEIKNIFYCDEPGKEKTIVIFADGTKVIKELVKGDIFDLNVGVALCVAERMYGGKTKYHKMVKKIAGVTEKKTAETRAIKVEIPKNADIKQTIKVAKEVLAEKPEISEAELNTEVKKKVSKKK